MDNDNCQPVFTQGDLGFSIIVRASDDPFIDGAALLRSPSLTTLEQLTAPVSRCLVMVALLALGVMGWSYQARQLAAPMPPIQS